MLLNFRYKSNKKTDLSLTINKWRDKMKKLLFVSLLLLLCTSLFGQEKFTEFQAGFLVPEDAKTGFIGGITFGRMLDENIGWAVELDYYGRTYEKSTEVPDEGWSETNPVTVTTEIENSTTMLPIFFKLVYLTQVGPNFDLRVGGGIGYEFMWNSETNYRLNVDKTRFYSGFTWQIGGGLSLPISRAADFFGDVSYHGGTPSRDEGETEEGLPLRTEVDMSGFMVRLGIRLYTFGL